jgi:hypothetical protein
MQPPPITLEEPRKMGVMINVVTIQPFPYDHSILPHRRSLRRYSNCIRSAHPRAGQQYLGGRSVSAEGSVLQGTVACRVDVITRILLKGETGPIGDEIYGEGLMLPFENTFNDKQLADLINYVGLTWNGWRGPVNASEIGTIRAKIKDRKPPYTNKELLKIK